MARNVQEVVSYSQGHKNELGVNVFEKADIKDAGYGSSQEGPVQNCIFTI